MYILTRTYKHFVREMMAFYNAFKYGAIGGSVNTVWWSIRHLHIYATNCELRINTKNLANVHVFMYGSNHKLIIGKGVKYKRGTICFEDNGCEIQIGEGTTIEDATLSAAEDNSSLVIGKDCMLSSDIYISTTDSHSIISTQTGSRINPPASVSIGNHVWIGYRCTINKGVNIGNFSVVGGNSVVTKDVQENVIVAGVPAQIVKTNVNWDRVRRPFI